MIALAQFLLAVGVERVAAGGAHGLRAGEARITVPDPDEVRAFAWLCVATLGLFTAHGCVTAALFAGGCGVVRAVGDAVPVDVEVPGCPPRPAEIIEGCGR